MGGISIYDLVSFSVFFFSLYVVHRNLCVLTHSFPTRRSSSLRAPLRQALRSQTILDPQAAARSAAWLSDADAAIDWAVAGAIASWADTDDGCVIRDRGYPAEIFRRIVETRLRANDQIGRAHV